MPDALPSPNQYETPSAVQERHARHLRALAGTVDKSEVPDEQPPQLTTTHLPQWYGDLGNRAQQILKHQTPAANSLLTWLSMYSSGPQKQLSVNANGFVLNIEVHSIQLEAGKLVVTIPTASKVSFELTDGVTLKLKWEGEADWNSFVYLCRLDLGPSFPFFFMVFLEDTV